MSNDMVVEGFDDSKSFFLRMLNVVGEGCQELEVSQKFSALRSPAAMVVPLPVR